MPLAALIAAALLIAGCGDAKQTTADDGGATPATQAKADATPATGDSGSSKSDESSAKPQSDAKPEKQPKDESAPDDFSSDAPKFGSKSDEDEIKRAVAQIAAATAADDAAKLCNKLYSREYRSQLDQRGGCTTVVSQRAKPFSKYSIKVVDVQFINDSDAQVPAKSQFVYDGKAKSAKPTLNFKLEDGAWKYYIRVKN